VFFELSRQIAVTGKPTVEISIEKVSEICKLNRSTVSHALTKLEHRKLIRIDNTRPKSITVLYDLTLKLRAEERSLHE
jgi:DNA-binding transcriptional ArsR family regulator